jgi:hypothetical protein
VIVRIDHFWQERDSKRAVESHQAKDHSPVVHLNLGHGWPTSSKSAAEPAATRAYAGHGKGSGKQGEEEPEESGTGLEFVTPAAHIHLSVR